jgi:hypothetical protein
MFLCQPQRRAARPDLKNDAAGIRFLTPAPRRVTSCISYDTPQSRKNNYSFSNQTIVFFELSGRSQDERYRGQAVFGLGKRFRRYLRGHQSVQVYAAFCAESARLQSEGSSFREIELALRDEPRS